MPRPRGLALGAIQEHEIDIGGDIELATAELAESGHRETGLLARGAEGIAGGGFGLHECCRDAFLGERGGGREDLIQARQVVQVAVGEIHHDALAQAPQAPAEIRAVAGEKGAHLVARPGRCRAALQVHRDLGSRVDHTGDVARKPERAIERGNHGALQ